MTRDEAKQFLINSGVAEPTDEAVTNLLNTIQKSVKSAEDKAAHFRAEAERVKSLESELDELKGQNMTEVEKLKKELDDTTKRLSISEQTVRDMQMKASLAEIGITGEDSEGLFNENGELNTTKLGEILTNREKNAVATYQKEALNSTPSPQGSGEPEEKPDVKYAKEYVAKSKANNSQSIIDIYTRQ